MRKFDVLMETRVSKTVTIEAETAEEAVLKASKFCKQTVEVDLSITWTDYSERVEAYGELSMEFAGFCDSCGYPLIYRRHEENGQREKHPKGWPWVDGAPTQAQVGEAYNPDYFTWCYDCLQSPLHQLANQSE